MGMIKNLVQDTASYGSEKTQEARFNLEISGKKGDIEKVQREIGALIYTAYCKDETSLGDDVVKLCEEIKKLEAEIEGLEKQKKENTEKEKTERQNRR
ncbi:MAG: hypothetical protein LBG63_00065 [Candidatus Methanoplasma sp.]|jgi:vacuolar-type H+-ATPase subunit I/STV1|nr:hypothetical protein [Candidatus Methanoplasma sp.]